MFEGVEIRDYQAHAQRRIKFGPQATTIVGPSDRGKSSIIRAIMWVCLNQPNGVEYIRWGASDAQVRLLLDGGRRLMRARGKELGNIYRLDGQEYSAVASDVPQDIATLLGVTPDNFQLQLDGPYWLGDKPVEVARQLNAIVDLAIIDASTGWLAGEQRRAVILSNAAAERLKTAQAANNKHTATRAMVADAKALHTIYATAVAHRARADGLGALCLGVALNQTAAKARRAKAKALETLLATMTATRAARQRAGRLGAAIDAYKAQQDILGQTLPTAAWNGVQALYHSATRARAKADTLGGLIDSVKTHQQAAATQRDAYTKTKAKLPKTCPTCQQPLKS